MQQKTQRDTVYYEIWFQVLAVTESTQRKWQGQSFLAREYAAVVIMNNWLHYVSLICNGLNIIGTLQNSLHSSDNKRLWFSAITNFHCLVFLSLLSQIYFIKLGYYLDQYWFILYYHFGAFVKQKMIFFFKKKTSIKIKLHSVNVLSKIAPVPSYHNFNLLIVVCELLTIVIVPRVPVGLRHFFSFSG